MTCDSAENKTDECTSDLDGFSCTCKTGYEGSLCQHNIDDCENKPCNHGTCTDGLNTYTCDCEDGWEGNLYFEGFSLC